MKGSASKRFHTFLPKINPIYFFRFLRLALYESAFILSLNYPSPVLAGRHLIHIRLPSCLSNALVANPRITLIQSHHRASSSEAIYLLRRLVEYLGIREDVDLLCIIGELLGACEELATSLTLKVILDKASFSSPDGAGLRTLALNSFFRYWVAVP